jgi:hypothetical protein
MSEAGDGECIDIKLDARIFHLYVLSEKALLRVPESRRRAHEG